MDSQQLNDILQRLAAGELDVAAAAKALSGLETADLGFAQIDHQRAVRCGFSEVVYGVSKSADQIAAIIRNFLEHASNVLVTRLDDTAATALAAEFPQAVHVPTAGLFAVFHHQPEKRHGRVAVLSAGTSDGAVYGYGGFGIDLYLGRCKCIIFTPDFAVGYFEKGDGKDLGNDVEFRSGGEISYRFQDRSRVGIAIHHLSNAGLGDSNPGEESFMVNYSIPVNWIVGD